MNVPGITSPDMSATINGAVKAGWEYVGHGKNHTVGRIRWPKTGAVVTFSTTPKAGGWKSTADLIFKESGVDLRRKGSNRRSRKSPRAKVDAQVEASRRRHRRRWEANADEREAAQAAAREATERERARRQAAADAEADERRRRSIEGLMRH